MTMDTIIKEKLEKALAPERMELFNDSHKHAGHAGDDGSGQTHYRLIIVSERFENLGRIDRQRLVYEALKEEMSGGIHALNVKAIAPSESA